MTNEKRSSSLVRQRDQFEELIEIHDSTCLFLTALISLNTEAS